MSKNKKIKSEKGVKLADHNSPQFEDGFVSINDPHFDTLYASSWRREEAPDIDTAYKDFTFQQLEIDEAMDDNDTKMHMIRMYGSTKNGHSVLCKVHGFLTYFYLPAPNDFEDKDKNDLKEAFEGMLNEKDFIESIHIVKKRSIMHYYSDDMDKFIKISVKSHRYISKLRGCIINGFNFGRFTNVNFNTFESNIEFLLRFMIDKNVVGGNWITLKKGLYRTTSPSKKISNCQYEFDVNCDNFISHAPEGEWSDIAPIRVLSFDIECKGRKGVFPDPKIDPVIQIGNVVKRQGDSIPFMKIIFSLDTCAPISDAQVLSFKKEEDLLLAWSTFVRESDPDLIIGYNTNNFDFTYLLDRANTLGLNEGFPFLGRIKSKRTIAKDSHFSSRAYGSRDTKVINIEGRLQLDMLQVMIRDHKLRSYSLNSVCEAFLAETKEDVHYSIISSLQEGSPESRRRLALYCLKDSLLPLRLMDKLMCFVNYLEMARVTGVPFGYLLTRGQQIKVISQLFRKAGQQNYLIPHKEATGGMDEFEGATVIEPKKGYYKEPIATLDFASLYPSIMMAHNLCYTTLINESKVIESLNLVKGKDYIITPNECKFVTSDRRKGLLPLILEELIQARKRAKKDLKNETDPFKKAVLDGRQLALKITANSVYGFTGATVGKLPCLEISSSVTAYGRSMINQTAKLVEEKFPNSNVIYGDTDSVMVKFPVDTIPEAMKLGKEAADLVSKEFINPIKLEFEKVYCPYLLINKKRYAGLYWSRPDKYDKLDAKGIETVRRDSCQLVSTLIGNCLNKALIEADAEGAVTYAKNVITNLLTNKIDMSQLVITKQLAKPEYDNRQPHAELAKKMRKRDPGSAPNVGDRVAYVIVTGAKNSNIYDRSEDPLYVLKEGLTIDTAFYLENQISKPLLRIFEPILGDKNAKELLYGEHTRFRTQNSGGGSRGVGTFFTKRSTCLSCKNVVVGNRAACENCRSKIPELYQSEMVKAHEYQIRHSRLWAECQRCQGSLLNEVQCASSDCPIFYMRTKAEYDAKNAANTLKRFDFEW